MNEQNAHPFRRLDYIKITLFGFALTALWQSLHAITLPVRLLAILMPALSPLLDGDPPRAAAAAPTAQTATR